MKEMMWQAACVRSGSEKRVSNFCKKNGIDHYCPMLIKSNSKKSSITSNNESGYCFDGFVFTKVDDLKSNIIETCSDVYHFLCWFGKKVLITSTDMHLIEKISNSDKPYKMEQLYLKQNNKKNISVYFNENQYQESVINAGHETIIIQSLRIKLTEIQRNHKAQKYNYDKYYYWL